MPANPSAERYSQHEGWPAIVTRDTWDSVLAAANTFVGKQTSLGFELDPKHLAFVLSRYKFVAKILGGRGSALEIGCGDGFGTTIVASVMDRVLALDVEPDTLDNRSRNSVLDAKVEFRVHDILAAPTSEPFDAAFSLDVIEHIPTDLEDAFYGNIIRSLKPTAMCVIGTPNKSAEGWQSEISRRDHVNLKIHDGLAADMEKHFDYVLMFGMNDEVVHTGFGPMCHYLMAIGIQPRL